MMTPVEFYSLMESLLNLSDSIEDQKLRLLVARGWSLSPPCNGIVGMLQKTLCDGRTAVCDFTTALDFEICIVSECDEVKNLLDPDDSKRVQVS